MQTTPVVISNLCRAPKAMALAPDDRLNNMLNTARPTVQQIG
jgi:hypothetical protein